MDEFEAPVWRWQSRADGWFFVTLPEDLSDRIDERAVSVGRGFGSVRVRVQIGQSRWSTSVFPDKNAGAFVLPLKKAVRTANDIREGDTVTVALELDDPA